jgi:hypothetical protein
MRIVRWNPERAQADGVLSLPKLRWHKWGGADANGPDGWHFRRIRPRWEVDGAPATPEQVADRLQKIGGGGVIQLLEPFFNPPELKGQPVHNFGTEWRNVVSDGLEWGRMNLVPFIPTDQIDLLIDHERWEKRDYAGKPLTRPWAHDAIVETCTLARRAGWRGQIGNHATGFLRKFGRPAQTSSNHVSRTVLAGYAHENFMYTPDEIIAAMDECMSTRTPWWFTLHRKNDQSLADAARKRGCDLVLLWA